MAFRHLANWGMLGSALLYTTRVGSAVETRNFGVCRPSDGLPRRDLIGHGTGTGFAQGKTLNREGQRQKQGISVRAGKLVTPSNMAQSMKQSCLQQRAFTARAPRRVACMATATTVEKVGCPPADPLLLAWL